MFKYNELSDLKNGSLVTPLSKMDDGSIRCVDSNNQECFYTMKDFDFRKKPEERKLETGSLETEIKDIIKEDPPKEEVKQEEPKKDITYQDMLDEMEKDDSIYDGSDELPSEKISSLKLMPEDGFYGDFEHINNALNLAGIQKKVGKKYEYYLEKYNLGEQV